MTPPSALAPARDRGEAGFRHEMYPHHGTDEFLTGTLSFIQDALAGQEIVLVAVSADKEQLLRAEITGAPAGVVFLDTAALGRNPGRLIPAWQDWITAQAHAGHPVRGINEAAWSGRTAAESAELRYHEWLLNRAFTGSPAWWLLCPYDTTTLDPEILRAGQRCHPLVLNAGEHTPSDVFSDEPYPHEPLGLPCDPFDELTYSSGGLAAVREKVAACAGANGLDGARLRELQVAATECAVNSIKYGGGGGTLRTWVEDATLICEFHDDGHLDDPLAGRRRPTVDQLGGRGLWLVHQLCDLVQIRTGPAAGTTIRLHTYLDRGAD
ncbi:Anti-sigma regulatory factor (Ser/Thr protein kinase) [Streptomyces sp. DvalAA-14]|uniref:sensor histidine kinase n=1 Tax=unclassified Streptomyces TaxID=2593676 RepID=UPI00081B238E|nr:MULTISPECIES: sensor histidine kinase [unclassified Streptomyces]MYS20763.1 sensor histidine kinase [Streptomyces sp. SID4948]SCD76713.1 Anti-sigma regulatory factor (Ser/Thr protein kinase) [Streptomyces sp. DvalAA-14]